MRIQNTTDIPREAIAEVVRFVRPPGIANFRLRVTNCSHRGGRGFASGHNVTVRLAKTDKLARSKFRAHKGYLGIAVGSRMEALVMLLAHELRHVWQAKVPRGYRVWGARGRYSERDADAYALQKLRQWRRK